jgi:glycosyltransferase involved in cell wall biosynthesis
MNIALIHDWLVGIRGGEKVLEQIIIALKERYDIKRLEIFTLVHRKNSQSEIIENEIINTSFIQKLPLGLKKYRYFLPLFPYAIETFDLSDFDLVISSSHAVAKGVVPNSKAVHICYSHTPMRYIWDHYHTYFGNSGRIKKAVYNYTAKKLREWDIISSNRVDYFIANSNNVKNRIKKIYRRDARVIYPPVDTDFFSCEDAIEKGDYFLIVSALVPYKKVDVAIEAFNKTDYKLKIIGEGPEKKKLKKLVKNNNIEFIGAVDNDLLKKYYCKAKALIFPAEEDFGIVPVEAQSCGTPVIAYGKGGALETVINNETGIFFDYQTSEALLIAIDNFSKKMFNNRLLKENSKKFSKMNFKKEIIKFIDKSIKEK